MEIYLWKALSNVCQSISPIIKSAFSHKEYLTKVSVL